MEQMKNLPKNFEIIKFDYKVENAEVVEQAVNNLIELIEKGKSK